MQRSALVIAANALPVRLDPKSRAERWVTSPGGLVSALAPIARDARGAWIGWTGEVDRAREPFDHDGICNVPIRISSEELDGFYEGSCNRTFWPLYHYTVRHPEYHRHWWRHYEAVNRRVAERAAEIAKPGGTVWVHDYHFQLVPAMLRHLRRDVRIGFFLHIPFPPGDLFVQLPWRHHVLDGLLGADVIGFQTKSDVQNFLQAVRRLGMAQQEGRALRTNGRTVWVSAHPISIDTARYVAMANEPDIAAQAKEFRDRLGQGRRVFLGVDRLDYTKGIDLRLKAFHQMLQARPEHAKGVVLVQVAVPSREWIAEYKELRSNVEELVGQINGHYGEVGTAVVHYLRRTLPQRELVAMYRAADVMVVTPLCDGMNLVAKEYVATRVDNTGVLVLSEFAGAAAELRTALQVNPHNLDGMAEIMQRALEMPAAEADQRMRAMRRVVRKRTVHDWAQGFLRAMEDDAQE
jgi:trehalose 6-phosphate synthase